VILSCAIVSVGARRSVCGEAIRPIWHSRTRKEKIQHGDWLTRLGENERALGVWRELAAETPDDKDMLLRLGATLAALHDYSQAEAVLLKAQKLDSSDARVVHNLGLLRLNQGRTEEAKEYFRRTLSIRPWHPETNYHLGLMAERRGDIDRARRLYMAELETNSRCAKAWERYLSLSPSGRRISNRHAVGLFLVCVTLSGALLLLKRRSEGVHT